MVLRHKNIVGIFKFFYFSFNKPLNVFIFQGIKKKIWDLSSSVFLQDNLLLCKVLPIFSSKKKN